MVLTSGSVSRSLHSTKEIFVSLMQYFLKVTLKSSSTHISQKLLGMDTKTILQCVKKNQQTLHLITVTDTRCTLSALLGDTKCACVASGMKLHTKKKRPRENHAENVTISLITARKHANRMQNYSL